VGQVLLRKVGTKYTGLNPHFLENVKLLKGIWYSLSRASAVFWDVTSCTPQGSYQRIGTTCWFRFQGWIFFSVPWKSPKYGWAFHAWGASTSTLCIKMIGAVPRFNPLWLLALGLREGQSVCAITTREHIWFEERNYRDCGVHHTWLADRNMAGIELSSWCVPFDEECTHRTCVGMYHKPVESLFRFC